MSGLRTSLRPTWIPSQARRYSRPTGPWDGPTLDALITAGSGEIVDGNGRWSAIQQETLVARVAGGLLEKGVRRGDVVAWQLPNGIVAALLLRACWRIGAVASPVLHSLGTGDVEVVLNQSNPAVFLDIPGDRAHDPEALLAICEGASAASGAITVRAADLAVVLYTSGSTGRPKAVLHSHRALSWKARLMARVHSLAGEDSVLMPAPMAHISGLLNGVLVPGATGMRSVLVRRFDPAEALMLVERERVSFLAGPPTFFIAMAKLLEEHPGSADTSSIRVVSSGGASVTPAFVHATAAAFDCRVKRTYGSTEAPTVTTSTDADSIERAAETDGRAVGEVELRIVDPESSRILGVGEKGELWVRGPEMFAGYADAEQTAAVIAPDGWFRTGDLATLDGEGWLRIVGRLKDVIIRGGENISASEVEGALESHPAVRQAVAVGYPDPLMGERVAAFVVTDGPFDLEICRAWFADRGIAKFKTPERIIHLPLLPLLGSGKPDRAALTKQAASTSG